MNPPNNPQEINVPREAISNSYPGDIEAGSPKANFAMSVFNQLLYEIHNRRPHAYIGKREMGKVYERLMDQLDASEECHPKFPLSLISIQFLVLSGLTALLACTLTLKGMKQQLHLKMWQWVTMVLVIALGLSAVRFTTFLLLWPVERWWRIHKYVVFFTRQLKHSLDLMIWFCVVLVGWYIYFRPRLKQVNDERSIVVATQVSGFLIALCLGSFLWLLKNVLYLKLDADLHYDQLFDRLKQTVVYLHGLQILRHHGMWKFLLDKKSKKKMLRMGTNGDTEMMKGLGICLDVSRMEKESAPIWILRRLAEEYLNQVKLYPLGGTSDHIRDDKKILKEAKTLFKQLISNQKRGPMYDFSNPGIKLEYLKRFGLKDAEFLLIFKSQNKEEEEEEDEDDDDDDDEEEYEGDNEIIRGARNTVNKSLEDITIAHDEFLGWAARAHKYCWGLEKNLLGSQSVFNKLNRLLSILLLTVILIVWLLLSKIINIGQIALLLAPFIAASFIFGDSCKRMFEGLVFAFAMHPFDVGDCVIINNVQMRVKQMNILTTIFYKYDAGEEVIIIPNSTLTTTSITNLFLPPKNNINLGKNPDQWDKVEFVLSSTTPLEDITDLEIKIKMQLDEHISYSSNTKVVKSEVGQEEMKMTAYFKYLASDLTVEVKAGHRSEILNMIIELKIHMEINSREYYPKSYKPYIVELGTTCKLKMGDLEMIRSDMLRGLERDSKVVIRKLTKSRIMMGLYMGWKMDAEKIEDVEPKTHPKMRCKEICYVEDLYERLKRLVVVHEVKIFRPIDNGHYELIIPQRGRKWRSFRAMDVIRREQDDQNPYLQRIRS